MKNIFEQSCEKAKDTLRLSAHEKAVMRNTLMQFMEKNPARKSLFSRFARFLNPLKLVTKPIPLFSMLLALGMGIGTTYASDAALPGDFLYPLKIYVNEEVRGMIALTDEDSAQWEVDRAKRRLDEASKLVSLGAMNSELRAGIESNFSQSVNRAQKRILVLTSSGNGDAAFEMSSRFESALRAHQEIFARLQEKRKVDNKKEEDEKKDVQDLMKEVDRQVEHARTIRVTFETKHAERTPLSVERKVAQFATELADVRVFVAKRTINLSAQSKVRVEASLAKADELIAQAKSNIASGDLAAAFIALQSAGRELVQARLLAQSLVDLSIDVPVRIEKAIEKIQEKEEKKLRIEQREDTRVERKDEKRENRPEKNKPGR